jgi:RNA polymerase sigma factor (sigma-70 family)
MRVLAARAGDPAAFGALIARYTPMVRGLVRRMTGAGPGEDDLMQEAFLAAYLSLDALADPGRFRPWLYGITRYTCLMALRARRVMTKPTVSLDFLAEVDREPPASTPSPEALVETLEIRRLLRHLLHQLSPRNREAVLLFYYDGLSLAEIAGATGVSAATVKGRLHRARKHLQSLLITADLWPVHEGEKVMIPVEVVDVLYSESGAEGETRRKHYQLVLLGGSPRRALLIWIGEAEGLAIAYRLNGHETPRPMTQAFVARLLEASGATLDRVEISALRAEVFYATAHLRLDGEIQTVDARPSDAIALALHLGAPLFVAPDVLAENGVAVPEGQGPTRRGLDEIRAMVDALAEAEAAYIASQRAEDEGEARRNRQQEIAAALSRAFAVG